MNLRNIALSTVLLSSFATGAFAITKNEAPEPITTAVAEHSVKVDAGKVFNNRELTRLGFDADKQLKVSLFKSSGKVDRSSGND
ncbi:hypothetical protein [Paracoccus homiensis]|uniref:hypothetical protein n=1 Tax=Paracoccus homiensis TaxID=364199 RepID=UPI00398D0883